MKHLIFIVAYNHQNFITKVLNRLSPQIYKLNYEILIIDDASSDKTFYTAKKWSDANSKININILKNPNNLGYGGNQKIGMQYAIKNKFDTITLLHGDGQYAPEIIYDLLMYHINNNADLTLGSRMIKKINALKGKMPIYKFLGNIVLTKLQNLILKTKLSEFHTGYRIYSVTSLKKINFNLNSNVYHFDTEIILQFIANKFKIVEYPIPTYYGDEISYVNGFNYAYNTIKQTILYKIQKFGIFYEKKYDYEKNIYEDKSSFDSTHSQVIKLIKKNSKIIDLGSANAKYLFELKKNKNCFIKSVNKQEYKTKNIIDNNEILDLDFKLPKDINNYNYILLLDVIEHLQDPEKFVENLYSKIDDKKTIIVSTGNISFIIIRFMLLLGFFNYGNRGILDKTHNRLFTYNSFKQLFINNFDIIKTIGIPAPIPLVLGNNFISRILMKINKLLILVFKSLFSYQILFVLKSKTSLEDMLQKTIDYSNK